MSRRRTLLETVQGLLERTYAIPTGLVRADRFLIGDRGLALLYGSETELTAVASADGQGARLFVRETVEGIRAVVYFPDAMIRRLESYPPTAGVGEENVDAFATFVEEIDHLLVLADRAAAGRVVSRLELELHANVSKWLVVSRFVAGRNARLGERERHWLRWHLFRKQHWADSDRGTRERYRDASRLAVQFLDGWARTGSVGGRIAHLRTFHTVSLAGKLELVRRLAA